VGSALAAILAAIAALATAGTLAPAWAMTSHAGWPRDEHLVMDHGPAGRANVLRGRPHRHNYLLGGYGNDTIYGGEAGDVIWGDYHPSGWPARQTAVIHAGNGPNFIYANDTVNYVWTGTSPRGLRRDPLPGRSNRRLHEPPRPPPLPARRLPPRELLLGRLLSRPAAASAEPQRLTVAIPAGS
jgi:hypothetical protein